MCNKKHPEPTQLSDSLTSYLWKIENKYYTADVHLCACSVSSLPPQCEFAGNMNFQSVIITFDQKEVRAHFYFNFNDSMFIGSPSSVCVILIDIWPSTYRERNTGYYNNGNCNFPLEKNEWKCVIRSSSYILNGTGVMHCCLLSLTQTFLRCHFGGWKEMIILQNVALYMYNLRLYKNFSQLTFWLLANIHLYFLLSFLLLRFQYRQHDWYLIIIATMIGLRKLCCTLKDYNEPVFLIHHFARTLVCLFP